jgi:hypothetical protein
MNSRDAAIEEEQVRRAMEASKMDAEVEEEKEEPVKVVKRRRDGDGECEVKCAD